MAKPGDSFANDPAVTKYYGQRHRLWSKFDEGIWMTKSGWYEVTPERIAQSSASLHKKLLNKSCVLDLFCGCGGDTVQLARVYEKVIAVDKDRNAIEAAKKNVEVYGVANRVSFVCCDYRELQLKDVNIDAVHCSPPWGGTLYMGAPFFRLGDSLQSTIGVDFAGLFDFILSLSKNITIFLPRNTLLYSVIPPSFHGDFDVHKHYVNDRCKAITLAFGDLSDGSSMQVSSNHSSILRDKIIVNLSTKAT
ncbi:Methyltransferase small domain [Trypanosoma vivax]|uniref:Trimethylguanosine synthase n=1 Tax=Trypanosoma vivax (strain Y486) TaxID=1055687 RepID=G0UBT0_TRYVY|nr:Methyltransferase small domain [Trypanosoma vivax]CCC53278.1 hypothetical protein TVY486_1107620 [Trypanosoma vivax Y486]